MVTEHFFIQGEVEHSELPQWLVHNISRFGKEDAADLLVIWINSEGGDLLAAFEVTNLILNSPIPIYTVINGHAESAALLIAMCGHKRFIFNTSWGMAHHFSTSVQGSYHELNDAKVSFDLIQEAIRKVYLKTTTMEELEIDEILLGRATTWMSAYKLLSYGMVDELITNRAHLMDVFKGEHDETEKKKGKKRGRKKLVRTEDND